MYKPMAQALNVAFNALYDDYQFHAMSEKPILAIVKMLQHLDTDTPVWWNQGIYGVLDCLPTLLTMY